MDRASAIVDCTRKPLHWNTCQWCQKRGDFRKRGGRKGRGGRNGGRKRKRTGVITTISTLRLRKTKRARRCAWVVGQGGETPFFCSHIFRQWRRVHSSSESHSSSEDSRSSSSSEEDDYSKLVNNAISSSSKYSKILQQRKLEEEGLSSLDEDSDNDGDEMNNVNEDFNTVVQTDTNIDVIEEKSSGSSSPSSSSEDDDDTPDDVPGSDLSKHDLFRRKIFIHKHASKHGF